MFLTSTNQDRLLNEFRKGDFFSINVSYQINGEDETDTASGILVNTGSGRWYFLTNDETFDGANWNYKSYFGFRYSFILTNEDKNAIDAVESEIGHSRQRISEVRILIMDSYELPESATSAAYAFLGLAVDADDTSESEQRRSSEYVHNGYTKTSLYVGMHGYHTHGSVYNQPIKQTQSYKIGVELEVEFANDDKREDFIDKPSNWFYRERDGSLGSYGCEIITIPMKPSDIKSTDLWKTLCDDLSHDARSWDTSTCGLHVHIGREILGRTEEDSLETLGKMLVFYNEFLKSTRLDNAVFGRSRIYNECDGSTDEGRAVRLLGASVLKDAAVKDRVKDAALRGNSHGRYYHINLQNTNTIEFRKGRGSLNPERITAVIEYCERICLYAKHTPWHQISVQDFVQYLLNTAKSEKLKTMVADNR